MNSATYIKFLIPTNVPLLKFVIIRFKIECVNIQLVLLKFVKNRFKAFTNRMLTI